MKKLFTIMMLILLTGCSLNNKEDEIHPDGGICAPNIMVNDRHYSTTGLVGEETYEADGIISSSVDQSEIPHENDQSNFGTGYEYDIIDDEVIYVHIEGKWIRYEYYIPE